MIPLEGWIGFLQEYGLWIVAFASILEGPIVAVVSAAMAAQGLFDPAALFVVLVAGDLLGDYGHYALGRWGFHRISARWRARLGLKPERVAALSRQFGERGGRILVLGKLTHSAGAAVLVASGIGRMPIRPFLIFNLLASLPKTAALMALGAYAGETWDRVDLWLERGALLMLAGLTAAGVFWHVRRRRCRNA